MKMTDSFDFIVKCKKCGSERVIVYYTSDDDGSHFDCLDCENSWVGGIYHKESDPKTIIYRYNEHKRSDRCRAGGL
jgi:hypothetical protein